MKTVRISVRNLVEFILRSGDIDEKSSRGAGNDAMLEGARVHRAIQRAAGSDYSAEVSMKRDIPLSEDLILTVEGRADGIIERDGCITVDEIKGMYLDVDKLTEPFPIHLTQAKCYAAIWAADHDLDGISVRMTYVGFEDHHIKYFLFDYETKELEDWFRELTDSYRPWALYMSAWEDERERSLKELDFPYEYRAGQKDVAAAVYRTVYHGRKLFLEAPTGSGKTLATLYPGLKAMGEGLIEHIFFLTAKNVGARAASDAFEILRERSGLRFKTVNVLGKDRTCISEVPKCDPEECPFAKGHFDRVNKVLYDLLTQQDAYTREMIEDHSIKGMVCPYALTRDLTRFADGIICDYNYVFDPTVSLNHFFGEGKKGDHLFLVDEAHNLVDRARDIYSASLSMDDLRHMKGRLKGRDRALTAGFTSLIKALSAKESEYDEEGGPYIIFDDISPVINAALRLAGRFSELISEGAEFSDEEIEFYFDLSHFTDICDRLDEKYRIYALRDENAGFLLKLLCVDPSGNLSEYLSMGRASVFFSATLLPVTYYMDLIAGGRDEYTVYADSVFDPGKLGIFTDASVTSRYSRRSREEYKRIAHEIGETVKRKKGNYMAFFPSYSFLDNVYEAYMEEYGPGYGGMTVIKQSSGMKEEERDEFLSAFCEDGENLGFCVLGGLFSEGIDLTGSKLIGALIVGTGLPLVSPERDILKRYFDGNGLEGFDYAMKIPGMNKVLQAAGRVIRTEEDTGIVALLDDRFEGRDLRNMYPREWKDMRRIGNGDYRALEEFWEKHDQDR